MKDAIAKREEDLSLVTQSNSNRLAEVERSLEELRLVGGHQDNNDDEEDEESAESQLLEEAEALKAAQSLLPALLARLESGKLEEMERQSRRTNTNVSFGDQNNGFQIGVNDGSISGVTIGR